MLNPMKQLALLALAPMAFGTTTFADSIIVEVDGVVSSNETTLGPFTAALPGDPIQIRAELLLPGVGSGSIPNELVYESPAGLSWIEIAGIRVPTVSPTPLFTLDDGQFLPPADQIQSGPLLLAEGPLPQPLAWFAVNDYSMAMLSSPLLEQNTGEYPGSLFNTRVIGFRNDIGQTLLGDLTTLRILEPVIGTSFCGGDGSSTACPCGNSGASDEGCSNSTGVGATLSASGSSSIAFDNLQAQSSGLVPNKAALLFAGDTNLNGGQGVVFGDGIRCAGGILTRLGTRVANAGGVATWGPGIASQANWSAGDLRYLQVFYRDSSSASCQQGFNTSNGLIIETY